MTTEGIGALVKENRRIRNRRIRRGTGEGGGVSGSVRRGGSGKGHL